MNMLLIFQLLQPKFFFFLLIILYGGQLWGVLLCLGSNMNIISITFLISVVSYPLELSFGFFFFNLNFHKQWS